jgi:L-aspartate oxidase
MAVAAKLVAAAALRREESRGVHFRVDHPQTKSIPERTFLTLSDAERIAKDVGKECTARVGTHA